MKLSPWQAVVIILSCLSLYIPPEFIRGHTGPCPSHSYHFTAHRSPAPPPPTPALGWQSVHLLGHQTIRWGAEEAVEEMADWDRQGRWLHSLVAKYANVIRSRWQLKQIDRSEHLGYQDWKWSKEILTIKYVLKICFVHLVISSLKAILYKKIKTHIMVSLYVFENERFL